MEEKERKSGRVVVNFTLTISTKPSVVKFEVGGMATVDGKDSDIKKMLEVDPETKVPLLLHRVYQQVYKAIFLLAAIVNVPNPPPDLLFFTTKTSQAQEKREE